MMPGRLLRSAEKQVQKGRLAEAVAELERFLDKHPTDTGALNRLGDLLLRVSRLDDAVERFLQSARLFAADGFYVKAIAVYKKILRFDPDRATVYEELARLYAEQGLRSDARAQYEQLADALRRKGDAAGAIDVHLKMLDLEPERMAVRAKLIELLVQLDRRGDAAIEGVELGRRLIERERVEEAREVLEQARVLAGPDGSVHHRVDDLLRQAGILVESPAADPAAGAAVPPAAAALSAVPLSSGGPGPAAGDRNGGDDLKVLPWDGTTAQHGPARPVRNDRPQIDDLPIRNEEQSIDDVVVGLKSMISDVLDPHDAHARFSLALAYRDMGLIDEAVLELQKATEDPQLLIESCDVLGACLREQGEPEAALTWYAKALASPQLSDLMELGLRYEMGQTYLELGSQDAARESFSRVHRVDPEFRDVAQKLVQLS